MVVACGWIFAWPLQGQNLHLVLWQPYADRKRCRLLGRRLGSEILQQLWNRIDVYRYLSRLQMGFKSDFLKFAIFLTFGSLLKDTLQTQQSKMAPKDLNMFFSNPSLQGDLGESCFLPNCLVQVGNHILLIEDVAWLCSHQFFLLHGTYRQEKKKNISIFFRYEASTIIARLAKAPKVSA